MKLIYSHPTGNANVRAAACGLAKADLLAEFHTTIASFPGSMLDSLGAIGPLAEIRRRRYDPVLEPFTRMWPWREAGRLFASKAGFKSLHGHETGPYSVDAVYQSLDQRVGTMLQPAIKQGVRGVYAYEDGAVQSFRVAKRLGLQCLYDLPIGYWRAARRLLEPELERWPAWAPTLTGFGDSDAKLARKDEELQLADHIFVASRFTAYTLQDFPGPLAPIEVIPYGYPPVGSSRDYSSLNSGRPLKLLFVGSLSQRKGIADLFAAVDIIGSRVELTVVGRKANDNCPALDVELAKHRWISSLPHDQVLALMREHDVFVFPSLFEGFGLVITEAMSQGVPVITTDRTAGPDLIEHGRNGWLVDAGSTEALVASIEELLLRPSVVAEAGRAALESARARPWEVYGRELAAAIMKRQNG
ncbi:glycosyltransferase family 4 protein [Hymenobacter tibetensis]|uniref:Glycosyltransferase family 4 protein n=1 Tax=Hymenobacter tibetensis TaxID=497967 RepID=A0ABY4CZU6_9BACT|nr:glycosyltransferase family 4 protein [Hymenobacter tibetensis]UOG75799.1 glycosyltransferase family 4 protein [Hymenobacter tibetensis]